MRLIPLFGEGCAKYMVAEDGDGALWIAKSAVSEWPDTVLADGSEAKYDLEELSTGIVSVWYEDERFPCFARLRAQVSSSYSAISGGKRADGSRRTAEPALLSYENGSFTTSRGEYIDGVSVDITYRKLCTHERTEKLPGKWEPGWVVEALASKFVGETPVVYERSTGLLLTEDLYYSIKDSELIEDNCIDIKSAIGIMGYLYDFNIIEKKEVTKTNTDIIELWRDRVVYASAGGPEIQLHEYCYTLKLEQAAISAGPYMTTLVINGAAFEEEYRSANDIFYKVDGRRVAGRSGTYVVLDKSSAAVITGKYAKI